MKYVFHPKAKSEFLAAVDEYENREPGLGADFAIEIHAAIENILIFPAAWPILEDARRRCVIRRYPYGIIYSKERDNIFILAVMHLHRDPDYLKDRY